MLLNLIIKLILCLGKCLIIHSNTTSLERLLIPEWKYVKMKTTKILGVQLKDLVLKLTF